jgi:hypothetical protein
MRPWFWMLTVLAAACAGSKDRPAPPPRASAFVADLQKAGLDLEALPDSPRLLPPALRDRVMDSFTVSLGYEQCSECHVGTDYAKPTEKKTLALGMWQTFVTQLTLADGQPLWCDSCHQGRAEFLQRGNDDGLAAWMNENYVGALARKAGGTHSCASCHGAPFRAEIFAGWLGESG